MTSRPGNWSGNDGGGVRTVRRVGFFFFFFLTAFCELESQLAACDSWGRPENKSLHCRATAPTSLAIGLVFEPVFQWKIPFTGRNVTSTLFAPEGTLHRTWFLSPSYFFNLFFPPLILTNMRLPPFRPALRVPGCPIRSVVLVDQFYAFFPLLNAAQESGS